MNELTNLSLGLNIQQVKDILGEPKKNSSYLDYEVYWYSSQSPFVGELLFFKEDALVLKTYAVDQKALSEYLTIYGKPELSLRYYPDQYLDNDLKDTTLHMWPSKGIDIVSFGAYDISEVVQVREYSPQSLDEYLLGLGSEFSKNQYVQVQEVTQNEYKLYESKQMINTDKISLFDATKFFLFSNFFLFLFFSLLFFSILLIFFVKFIRRRNKKRPEEFHIENKE